MSAEITAFLLLSVSGLFQAAFAIPIKHLRNWRWEQVWVAQSVMANILLPLAWTALVPGVFWEQASRVPLSHWFAAYAWGLLWGLGGITYARVLFRNLGNSRFEELLEEGGPGVSAAHCSRGCAFGDFDNDGDLDILIVNLNEPPSLLRNDVKGNNRWLKLKLNATKSNRSAIGARAQVRYGGRQQVQEVTGQAGFLSVNDRRLHFGLGAEPAADVEVRWPSGLRQSFKAVASNRLVTVDETRGIVDAKVLGP